MVSARAVAVSTIFVGRDPAGAWTAGNSGTQHRRHPKAVWYLVRELERELPEATGANAEITAPTRLAIVGRGRMGGAIATAARAAGLEAVSAARDDVAEATAGADAALLCVPDDAIGDACEAVASAVPSPRLVGHTSGATRLDALEPAVRRGAEAFSLHPLQPGPEPGTDLTGAPCAVAGSTPAALAFATELAETLGMRPFQVPEERRAAYHAAASIASNFLVTLEGAAERLAATAGVDRALLAPLVRAAVDDWAARGAEDALTGPIARGDEETVARQREAVAERTPDLLPLWDAMVDATRVIA
jgi:predicted short-subunit dehydrogenase-like oxidoreductase (DUF2520 family)